MAIELSDDGTLDTVLRCSDCGKEFRFTRDDGPGSDEHADEIRAQNPNLTAEECDVLMYEKYVLDCIQEVSDEHECAPEDEEQDD
jgi:hypothetical protein